jgi:hypothetical protein
MSAVSGENGHFTDSSCTQCAHHKIFFGQAGTDPPLADESATKPGRPGRAAFRPTSGDSPAAEPDADCESEPRCAERCRAMPRLAVCADQRTVPNGHCQACAHTCRTVRSHLGPMILVRPPAISSRRSTGTTRQRYRRSPATTGPRNLLREASDGPVPARAPRPPRRDGSAHDDAVPRTVASRRLCVTRKH